MIFITRNGNAENINKGKEPYREAYSQAKRRRMLQFDNEILDVDMIPVCGKDFSSTYLKSKVSQTFTFPFQIIIVSQMK